MFQQILCSHCSALLGIARHRQRSHRALRLSTTAKHTDILWAHNTSDAHIHTDSKAILTPHKKLTNRWKQKCLGKLEDMVGVILQRTGKDGSNGWPNTPLDARPETKATHSLNTIFIRTNVRLTQWMRTMFGILSALLCGKSERRRQRCGSTAIDDRRDEYVLCDECCANSHRYDSISASQLCSDAALTQPSLGLQSDLTQSGLS